MKYNQDLISFMVGAVEQHNPKHWLTGRRVAEKLDRKAFRLRIELRRPDASLIEYKVFDELDTLVNTLVKPYHWLGDNDYPRFDVGLQDDEGNLVMLFKVTNDDEGQAAFCFKMSLGSSYQL
jgi:hypothetical protein